MYEWIFNKITVTNQKLCFFLKSEIIVKYLVRDITVLNKAMIELKMNEIFQVQ